MKANGVPVTRRDSKIASHSDEIAAEGKAVTATLQKIDFFTTNPNPLWISQVNPTICRGV